MDEALNALCILIVPYINIASIINVTYMHHTSDIIDFPRNCLKVKYSMIS